MYNYRKSGFAEVVLVLMESVLLAASSEESGVLLDFLLRSQGPAYTCRRYWDWFEPFILQNIQESFTQASTSNVNQTETNFRILQLIQKIKADHAAKIEEIKGAQPYLHWDVISIKDVHTVVNERKQFHVVLQEITTTISKSTPNPSEQSNDNLAKVNRGGWNSTQF